MQKLGMIGLSSIDSSDILDLSDILQELERKRLVSSEQSLEREVGKILLELIDLRKEYSAQRNEKMEGKSGFKWEFDFVLEKHGHLDAIIECKDIGGEEWERKTKSPDLTFETHMCREYTRLNDLHLKYPEVRLYVIVSDRPTKDWLLNKWQSIFVPIGIKFMTLDMIRSLPFETILG